MLHGVEWSTPSCASCMCGKKFYGLNAEDSLGMLESHIDNWRK